MIFTPWLQIEQYQPLRDKKTQ